MIVVDVATGRGICRTCKWSAPEYADICDEICKACSNSFIDSNGTVSKNWEAREVAK